MTHDFNNALRQELPDCHHVFRLRATQANSEVTGDLVLQMQHCYSAEIDPNLIVVNTDVEHIYIFNDLTKEAVTHDLDDALRQENSGLPPCMFRY